MALPVASGPTLVPCLAAETLLGSWDVSRTKVLGVQLRNVGAETLTPVIKTRLADSEAWVASQLLFVTPSDDGLVLAGDDGRVDIDVGASVEVAVFGQAAAVSTDVWVTARPSGFGR
jgi:hypothetical protein